MSQNSPNGEIQRYTRDENEITINDSKSADVPDIAFRPPTLFERITNSGVRAFNNELQNNRAEAALAIDKARCNEVRDAQLAMIKRNTHRIVLAKQAAMTEDKRQIEQVDYESKQRHTLAVSKTLATSLKQIDPEDLPEEFLSHVTARMTKTAIDEVDQLHKISYRNIEQS